MQSLSEVLSQWLRQLQLHKQISKKACAPSPIQMWVHLRNNLAEEHFTVAISTKLEQARGGRVKGAAFFNLEI